MYIADTINYLVVGETNKVRVPVENDKGERVDLTGFSIAVSGLTPTGSGFAPSPSIETQGGSSLGVFNFDVDAQQEGNYKFSFLIGGYAVTPRNGVGILMKAYEP